MRAFVRNGSRHLNLNIGRKFRLRRGFVAFCGAYLYEVAQLLMKLGDDGVLKKTGITPTP